MWLICTLVRAQHQLGRNPVLWVRPCFFGQCPAYLVHLIWMVFKMGSKWPNSCYFVGCCFQDLFKTTSNIVVCIYHHHHVVPPARISLTLSRHFSLSFITSGRSSGQHPVSPHSCCMYVRAGRPAFAQPYVGVHRSTSLMSSSLFLQQWLACLVRVTWIVFVMGGRWPYSWCFVGCCFQDLFNIACSILV